MLVLICFPYITLKFEALLFGKYKLLLSIHKGFGSLSGKAQDLVSAHEKHHILSPKKPELHFAGMVKWKSQEQLQRRRIEWGYSVCF